MLQAYRYRAGTPSLEQVYHRYLSKLDFCKQGSAAVAATETLVKGRTPSHVLSFSAFNRFGAQLGDCIDDLIIFGSEWGGI